MILGIEFSKTKNEEGKTYIRIAPYISANTEDGKDKVMAFLIVVTCITMLIYVFNLIG